ncbi:MAG: hypothetical protein IT579_23085 [Verrucomicrobia subdivision 3 bacterium]|nr:hypothetical protein [Limisphaerales bacterium]
MNVLKMSYYAAMICLLAGSLCAAVSTGEQEDGIVFETEHLKYVIDRDGSNRNYIDKNTVVDHCIAVPRSYLATLNRQGTQYQGMVTAFDAGKLKFKFGESGISAVIGVAMTNDYVTFEVLEISDTKGVTDLSLLNLTLDIKGEPGELFAACAVDLNCHTFNSNIPGFNKTLHVYCNAKDGFLGAKVAIVGCPGSELQTNLKRVIRDHKNLPQTDVGGPWAIDAQITRGSYLIEMGHMTENNVDEWIAVAKSIGARQIDVHCGKTLRFGDLEPNLKAYPSGFDGVKRAVNKLHAAGLAVGLHTYAFYLAKESKWVSPVPDPRLGKHKMFTLANDLDDKDATVRVKESTKGMSTITGFLIANSVTIQIDNELIIFSEIETNAPYAFTKCTRGALGTKPAVHAKGTNVSQLRELFGLFNPDGDSTLFDEVARRTAEVYNDCGFDMIYLDAIDGAGALMGNHTPGYYQAKFIFELNRHLKKPALMEMSSFDSHFWFARSRMGAWDVPSKSYKMFINNHYIDNLTYAKSFLPRNIGWWAIWDWTPKDRMRMFPDDIEYILCKSLASGDSLSWIECFTPESYATSASQRRFAKLIKQYEELRLSNNFSESTKQRLREIGQDYTLEQTGSDGWQFRPVAYDRHVVAGIDGQSNIWHTRNKYSEQAVKLRIEANLSLASYDSPEGEIVEDFKNSGAFSDRQSSSGVSFSIEPVSYPAKGGSVSGRFQAKSTQPDGKSAWSMTTKTFGSAVDFSKRGFGVWVHGDGNGEVLNFMWKAPGNFCIGMDEHYVTVDFQGWKYFEFIEPESEQVGEYSWPYRCSKGAPYVETAWLAYDKINSLTFGCINLPKGKEVKCYIGPIKALPHVTTKLVNPSVTLGGRKLIFPIELESGYYIDFRSMTDCKIYSPKGEVVREVKPQGEVPILKAGENRVEFNCGVDSSVSARANVTVISQDNQAFGK